MAFECGLHQRNDCTLCDECGHDGPSHVQNYDQPTCWAEWRCSECCTPLDKPERGITMDAVKVMRGSVQQVKPCSCGAARVAVMVPRASYEWDAAMPTYAQMRQLVNAGASMAHVPDWRLMEQTLDVMVCTRCDGGAIDDLDLNVSEVK